MRQRHAFDWRRILVAAVAVSLSVDMSWTAGAHEGEIHGTPAPGPGTSGGPVSLTPEARRNLGLETGRVETQSLVVGPTGFGVIEPSPGRVYVVSARISGRATRIFKVPGDPVRAGESTLEVESRAVADPPVRITLASRIGGVVTESHIETGQPVEPDQSLMTVTDLSHVLIRIEVFEVDFGLIAVDQPVEVRLESYPGRVFHGKIRRLGTVADSSTRTIPVWAELVNPDRLLRLNMRGSVRVITRETGPVVVVPKAAILGDPANRFVYLDTGPAFVPTPIVTGVEADDLVEIKSGLIPGDEVVITGNYELQYVVSPPASADTAPTTGAPGVKKKPGRFGCSMP